MIEDKKTDRKYRRHIGKYWKFLAIYSGMLVLVIAIGLIWIYGLLDDYEEGMPDVTMRNVVKEQFSADNIEKLIKDNTGEISKYENIDYIVSYVKGMISDSGVEFSRKSGEFTDETPVYTVKAGDKKIAKVFLKEDRKNGHGFTVWGLDRVSFGEFHNKSSVITITAPSGASVTINGVKAEDDIVEERDVPLELTKEVEEYIPAPANTIYKVEGLMTKPEIKAEIDGVQLEVTEDDRFLGSYEISYPSDEALLAEVTDHIKNINVEYGRYLINRGSLSRLRSYMIGSADRYISDIPAVWAFLWGKTYTYEFKTNEVSNLRKYSDDCFSCDIHFDLYVEWNTGDTTYDTNMSYVFVKQNDKWYLADFAIN